MTTNRKPPRWTIAFLRALERGGAVEGAALDAGIDKTSAYNRRKAHPDFAREWDSALAAHRGEAQARIEEKAGLWERVKAGLAIAPKEEKQPLDFARGEREGVAPARFARKEELLASSALGGKMVKAGAGRWNAAAEKRFFEELAASANIGRACEAAGVSRTAVYARRMKRPDFRAKWDAVLESGRAAIEMHLVESARNSFDPEDMDLGDATPRVSVAEAIRIVQLHGSKAQKSEIGEMEPAAVDVAEIRARLVAKLEKLRERMMPEMLAKGWSYDEEHQQMIAPGWVRAT
jgi:hypothetical protein